MAFVLKTVNLGVVSVGLLQFYNYHNMAQWFQVSGLAFSGAFVQHGFIFSS